MKTGRVDSSFTNGVGQKRIDQMNVPFQERPQNGLKVERNRK